VAKSESGGDDLYNLQFLKIFVLKITLLNQ